MDGFGPETQNIIDPQKQPSKSKIKDSKFENYDASTVNESNKIINKDFSKLLERSASIGSVDMDHRVDDAEHYLDGHIQPPFHDNIRETSGKEIQRFDLPITFDQKCMAH